MKWWNELWLNEGFATWVGTFIGTEYVAEKQKETWDMVCTTVIAFQNLLVIYSSFSDIHEYLQSYECINVLIIWYNYAIFKNVHFFKSTLELMVICVCSFLHAPFFNSLQRTDLPSETFVLAQSSANFRLKQV